MANADNITVFVLSEIKCVGCGGDIWTVPTKNGNAYKGKKFCSRVCRLKYNGISTTGKTREQLREETRKRRTHKCVGCGEKFTYQHRSPSAGKYCSRECYRKHKHIKANKKLLYSYVYAGYCKDCHSSIIAKRKRSRCESCTKKYNADRARESYLEKVKNIQVEIRMCVVCASSYAFRPSRGRGLDTDTCGAECSKKKQNRRSKEKYGSSYRARARAAGVEYEVVNRLKVFDRDGWRCQICGCSTPKDLQGTRHKRAPELDHRIPLSCGGGHLYSNVQCACRQCNGDKGASSEVGQLPLLSIG